MIPPGLLHVSAAVVALVCGVVIFAARKGTMRHRRLGFLYLGAMIYVNLAAWAVDTDGALGPFHVLTLVSVATLAAAYGIVVLGRRGRATSEAHGIMMAWSYAGAVAAGLGQAAVVAELPVDAVIAGTLAAAGVLIHVVHPGFLEAPQHLR